MAKKQSNYTYTEEQLSEQLKAYPHLVQDALDTVFNHDATNSDNTQGSLIVSLRGMARYNDVSKTKMTKLVASLVGSNRLTGWVSQRKHGFVKAGSVKATKPSKPKAAKKTAIKKNKGGRLSAKQQIQKEEKEKALAEYRVKFRKQVRKQYGLD